MTEPHATSDRAAETALLLDALRSHNMQRTETFGHRTLGLSSTQLVISTVAGDPVEHHPWDEGDLQGLRETFRVIPETLSARARKVYDQQVDLYLAQKERTR